MRKIERQMLQAINTPGQDMTTSNTKVRWSDDQSFVEVRLHDNIIASINWATQCIAISDAGWQTNTTKSRLNALLQGLGNRAHIHQKNFVWHLTRGLDATEAYVTEMERGQAYAVSL